MKIIIFLSCILLSFNQTMIQQLMTSPKEIIFQNIPIPEPSNDQVLISIKRIGICGSDIHVYHGTHPFTSYPITQRT